jgi:hypothetical protein
LLLVGVLALSGWAAVVLSATRGLHASDSDIDTILGDNCAYDTRSDPGREHVPSPTYGVDPPSGGPHLQRPAAGGFYEGSGVPTDGELVHALEHGFVIVWLKVADERTTRDLRALVDDDRAVIVAPRPTMAPAFAVTAWHRRLVCDEPDVAAVRRVVKAFRSRGPERLGL